MTASPPPIDRSKLGAYARNVVARARSVSERGRRLLAASARLQEAIRRDVDALSREPVADRLARAPIGELRQIVSKGLRLGRLEQAGFDTVAKIRNAPQDRLLEVPGVGAQTVEEVKAAAEQLAARIGAETRFRFDLGAKDPKQARLLAMLEAERSATESAGDLRGAVQRFEQRTLALVPLAKRAASRWRMLWSGRRRKAQAMAALDELEAVVDGRETRSLDRRLDEALRRCDPDSRDPKQLWRAYESDAAVFNTALARITGTDAADTEAADDFIGTDLRDQIETGPFDTSLLKTDLRMYQLFGAKYAIHQQRSIIGDEMGLGKTLQALAVCAHLAASGQRRFLVVCPASVQANWIAEIRKHTKLASFSLHGADRETEGKRWLRLGGVAVTTFDTLGRLQILGPRRAAGLALLIVDEAHYVKNPAAKRSQDVAALAAKAQRTLLLTGTPMENRVEEFKHLVSYLRPDLAADIEAEDSIAGADAFRREVAPVYLRRNQEEVLDELPEKIEVEEWLRLSAADETAYRAFVRDRNLMGMRRTASAMPGSEKLDRLAELVEEAVEDRLKVIVFSYFLDVLEAVRERLGSAVVGTITGSVSAHDRQELVDRFTRAKGPAVLVAQIEAGGVGLNIQAASVVVICEPQWKPSVENQAIARAHRMGQARKVQVHRLLAKDCVDERIREIQENKTLLFDHYARRSEAKEANLLSIGTGHARPVPLDDEAVPLKDRIIVAERHRLGLD